MRPSGACARRSQRWRVTYAATSAACSLSCPANTTRTPGNRGMPQIRGILCPGRVRRERRLHTVAGGRAVAVHVAVLSKKIDLTCADRTYALRSCPIERPPGASGVPAAPDASLRQIVVLLEKLS